MKTTLRFFLLAVLVLAAGTACQPPSSGSAGAISGTVRDMATGAPISLATVMVGGDSVLTGADGSFSFSYPSAGPMTTDIFVYKGVAYSFWGVSGVSIDTATQPVYTFYLTPQAAPPSAITISGDLPETSSAGANINVIATNDSGGIAISIYYMSAGAATYSVTSRAIGNDCLVALQYDPDGTGYTYREYHSHVDLTASAVVDMTGAAGTTVTVTGPAGEALYGDLDLSPVDNPNYFMGALTASPTDISVYNPDAYPMVWKTITVVNDEPEAGFSKYRININPSWSFNTTLALSGSAASIPAPTTYVTNQDWNPVTHVLSFTGGSGATMHMTEYTTDTGYHGFVFANNTSISFPANFVANVFDQGTGWDVKFLPIYSNRDLGELVDMRLGIGGPMDLENAHISYLMSNSGQDMVTDMINP